MNPISNLNPSQTGNNIFSSRGAKFADNPFLQLLVTEMKTQTPLEPVDNGAFMEQMASFSSMEQQKELNDNLLQLLEFQGALARLQGLSEASSLLGKELEYEVEGGKKVKGIAESVFVDESGEVRIRVGADEISLRQVLGVSQSGDEKKED